MSASLVCGKSLEAPGFSLWSSAHSEMSNESSIAPEHMHVVVSEDDRADPSLCVQGVDVLVSSWSCGDGAFDAVSEKKYREGFTIRSQ